MKSLSLRDYQLSAIEGLREGVRNGHRRQVLVAPTGSGKTVLATYLMREADQKYTRSVFVCDRVALVDQTSSTFDDYGIAHGVLQGSHWRWRPYERTQVASAQTLARRGWVDDLKLLVVDECHAMYRGTTEYIKRHPDLTVVGLTATPFTKGMGEIYTNVVNVTSTDRLIAEGWLAPVKCYAAKAADMTGAKTKFDGEWADSEVETRGRAIIGDIVSEWTAKTREHFGGPVKTIVFSATVAHGEELCEQFQAAGFNFQQISYKDGNDDRRRQLIDEFRKPDSEIVGLVSCEALAKGFDVPDLLCGVSARPYRKSLSSHIQQLGRVMRSSPGKEYALWLDHSGNILRFAQDTSEVFQHGVSSLDDGGKDAQIRKEPTEKERKDYLCGSCSILMPPKAPRCPACGWERPRKSSNVETISGSLFEVSLKGKTKAEPEWLRDRTIVWKQLAYMGMERKSNDPIAAKKFALAQYQNIYGEWPSRSATMDQMLPPSYELSRRVQSNLIRYFKRRAA